MSLKILKHCKIHYFYPTWYTLQQYHCQEQILNQAHDRYFEWSTKCNAHQNNSLVIVGDFIEIYPRIFWTQDLHWYVAWANSRLFSHTFWRCGSMTSTNFHKKLLKDVRYVIFFYTLQLLPDKGLGDAHTIEMEPESKIPSKVPYK